ncbi:hypothetical protein F5I97DRAFT_1857401 [Phlebopus sp. FC_14]|nr:hypothetical protein F5I97DRAFT_1857401 [Phlebopus sp. FC_14]
MYILPLRVVFLFRCSFFFFCAAQFHTSHCFFLSFCFFFFLGGKREWGCQIEVVALQLALVMPNTNDEQVQDTLESLPSHSPSPQSERVRYWRVLGGTWQKDVPHGSGVRGSVEVLNTCSTSAGMLRARKSLTWRGVASRTIWYGTCGRIKCAPSSSLPFIWKKHTCRGT